MAAAEHHDTLPGAPEGRYWVFGLAAACAR